MTRQVPPQHHQGQVLVTSERGSQLTAENQVRAPGTAAEAPVDQRHPVPAAAGWAEWAAQPPPAGAEAAHWC